MIPKGRAHTPELKRQCIEQILAVWLQFPEQRLGQLLSNAHVLGEHHQISFFYLEDDKLSQSVMDFAANIEYQKSISYHQEDDKS